VLTEDEYSELYSSPFQFSREATKQLQDRETKSKVMLLDLAVISQETPFSLYADNKKPDHQKLFDAIKKKGLEATSSKKKNHQ